MCEILDWSHCGFQWTSRMVPPRSAPTVKDCRCGGVMMCGRLPGDTNDDLFRIPMGTKTLHGCSGVTYHLWGPWSVFQLDNDPGYAVTWLFDQEDWWPAVQDEHPTEVARDGLDCREKKMPIDSLKNSFSRKHFSHYFRIIDSNLNVYFQTTRKHHWITQIFAFHWFRLCLFCIN